MGSYNNPAFFQQEAEGVLADSDFNYIGSAYKFDFVTGTSGWYDNIEEQDCIYRYPPFPWGIDNSYMYSIYIYIFIYIYIHKFVPGKYKTLSMVKPIPL